MMHPDTSDPAWRKAREKAWKRVWKLNKMDNSTREARDWLFGVFMGDREYEFESAPWDYTKHYGPADHYRAFHFSPFQSLELWKRYIEVEGPCYLCERPLSEIDRVGADAMGRGARRLSRYLFWPSLDMVNHYDWEREAAISAVRWMHGDIFDPEYSGHGLSIAYPVKPEEFVARYCGALSCWGVLFSYPEDSIILNFVDLFISAIPYVSPAIFYNGRSRVLYSQQETICNFVRNATGKGRASMERCRKGGVASKEDLDSFLKREKIMSEIVDKMRALNIDYVNNFIDRQQGQGEMNQPQYDEYLRKVGYVPEEIDVPADYLKF
ncbi:hypothetical protein [Isoalcanivorax indicus]|uniref:hypothetical protein n=1 Tax=Isoalcanivorax indicus TaxID=2202653 RepID=UPI000DB99D15|nr:hypothetical protein [Isoalcanivorax indicus]